MDLTSSRILIVDDTQKNIQVLGTILREGNYQINVAQNGQQALDVVDRVKPDLILLDIMMPVMDGFEACKRLKENPETADIPIIFLTAKTEAGDIVKGFQLGAVDYVTKPFNAAELFVRVDSHLTRCRLQKEVEAQLEEISRMKAEQEFFVRNELQNRVDPIVESLQTLIENGIENLSESQRQSLGRVAEGADGIADLLRLLEKLQDFEKGKYDPSMSTVQLDQLLRRVISDLEMTFGNLANIVYQNMLSDPTLHADADLLVGATQGLIKFAVERVAGHSDVTKRAVNVTLNAEDTSVVVIVRHGGAASSVQDLVTLLEEQDSGKSGGGLWPGLARARLVARAHGGRMLVEGDGTEGATYKLTLPRRKG